MRVLPVAPARHQSLSDAGSVVLASAVILGSKVARPLPLAVGLGVGLVAVSIRWPWLLVIAAGLVASALGARAEAGLHPVAPAEVARIVTLVSDPSPTLGGVRALVRLDGRRLEVRASGAAAGAISVSLAGEQVAVTGRMGPPPPSDAWLRVHHVAGLLEARTAERAGAGTAPWRAANHVRRLLERGASSLPPGPRSLFSGFVLGDDRDEPATVADDFQASGLTHLLAVSGENLAFVLALLGPVLRRLRLGARWAATIAAIAFFALITRGEPSVLRAAMMAGLSVSAGTFGRQVRPIRLLALAVTVLVLVDPFLVDSVGFRLSVGASLGIVLLAPGLRRSLPGPAAFSEALAVTLAAQAGVAPVIISSFGGLPVAAVPANLLAVPVAGLVMIWGLGAGLLAGALGGRAAAVLHLPTRGMIAWISGVAERAARWPLGTMGRTDAALFIAGLLSVLLGVRTTRRSLVRAGYGLVGLALVLPAMAVRWADPALQSQPVAGVVVWRADGATIVELTSGLSPDRLLAALRGEGVRRVDLLVLRNGGATAVAQTAAVRHRWAVRSVLEPLGASVPGAEAAAVGDALRIGPISVTVLRTHPRLEVQVRSASARSDATGGQVGSLRAPRARSPPPRRHVSVRGVRHPEPHAGLLL